MALVSQQNNSSRRWVIISACLLLAIGFASMVVLPVAEWPAREALGARGKASSRLDPDQVHFEALRVTVGQADAVNPGGEEDGDDVIGGDVDYSDYVDDGDYDRDVREISGASDVVEEVEIQEDYDEEGVSQEDQEAEESAEYDTEDLDETDLDESGSVEAASIRAEKDGGDSKKKMPLNLRDYDLTRERATQVATTVGRVLGPRGRHVRKFPLPRLRAKLGSSHE